MVKKIFMAIALVGLIGLSGCHATSGTAIRARAEFYDPYPYMTPVVYPYPVLYTHPFFYPFYDPFFFRADFLFIHPAQRIIILDDTRFVRRGRSLRGGRSVFKSNDSTTSHKSTGRGRSLR